MLFAEGDAITDGPLTGSFYDRFSWPTLTPDGVARWTSDYAATSGGPVVGGALFSDSTAQDVLLKTGDSVAAGLTIDAGFLSSNLAWSQLGSNYLTTVSVVASEEVVILNGQAVSVAGGGLLRENDPIPAQAGGLANETWALGSLYEVNEAGDWASSASVRLAGEFNTTADLIVVNGVIRYRDGDVIDGHTLSGLPSDISLNDRGDVAFVWDNKVFLNDKIIAQVGDSVDTNGDGAGDVVINNLFDVDLTNLPSAEGDGSPLLYLGARVTGSRKVILRNTPVTLAGDYNGDGVVNAADYTVWRDTEGTSLLLGADGDGDNTVNTADYGVWSAAYGTSVAPSIAIPEPLAVALLAALLTPLACRR
ncbi:hypothetical protein Pla108_34270 [Botrimarina colliarenosi]|uniref:Dockerin domain-containing protein n=1 Tax=Botrimarina colliarenosi TaxID=2528001 RepID=A0A5C6A5M4_9BACT|nr:hypothetical protein [Botrimarina colliarenosi]TWT95282.1 hypothetical protein Pla108_34270 [Botrimarina colliarenosi]